MFAVLLAQVDAWKPPIIDWHAIAPELILIAGVNLILLLDLSLSEAKKWVLATLTGFVLLAALIPVVTLFVIGDDSRQMFGGRYVIDEYALVMKGFFLLVAYVVVLLSQNDLEEGSYYQGEYYILMLCAILGMVVMTSARDLISIFVAFELLSIPTYMLAAWNKRSERSNEAGIKYYLIGVFATGVLLYGMSLLFGATNSTLLVEIGEQLTDGNLNGLEVVGIVFMICGFAFKISAVPFHSWAPDTYEGAPTPVTAFLSVASKAGGFVALVTIVYVAFPNAADVYQPFIWVMAALTMTVGNVLALRQTNIVRMLAYSSVSQGGFVLMPLAFAGEANAAGSALNAVVVYLLVYGFMNLGAFAVVIAVTRKTRSAEISSFGGLFGYAPGLAVFATMFFASLAGIPPLGGWFAKFNAFRAVLDAQNNWAYILAAIAAVNTVIAAAYYMKVLRTIWMDEAPDGDVSPIVTPSPILAALTLTVIGTLAVGVYPRLVAGFGELQDLDRTKVEVIETTTIDTTTIDTVDNGG